jgi:uncharacterized protein involved in outer membrane biogenesis
VQADQTGSHPQQVSLPARGKSVLRRAWFWVAIALAFLICAYMWAGFTLVPGLIRTQATAWVKTDLDKPIALGEIRFNPITFTLDVSDIAIPGPGRPMVAVGHLRIGFSILSLFQHAYRFNEVRLDRPFVRAVVRPDHSLNLIELMPKSHSKGPNPAVRIDTFSVDQGKVAFADQSLPLRPEKTLAPITFTLKDFHTNQDEGGAFALNAKSERGEGFVWTGNLSIAPIASRGRLTVSSLQSDTIQKFLSEELPVALTGGQIGFTADYDFAYADGGVRLGVAVPNVTLSGLSFDGKKNLFNGSVRLEQLNASVRRIALVTGSGGVTRLEVAMPRLELHGFGISPPAGTPERGIRLADATLNDMRLDHGARKIELGSLTLDGAALSVLREHNGKINLMALMPASPAAPVAAGPVPAPWKIHLGAFALNAATVGFEDRAVSPAARFIAAPINVSMAGAGSDLSQPVTIHFDARINGKASIGGEGAVTPADKAGDLKFTLANLPLRAFAAYMPHMPGLELQSGSAGASGSVHFQGGDISALRFLGDAGIDNFSLLEKTTNSPLFAWQSVSLKAIDYRKNKVEIGHARLVRPLGRIAVLADRRFNFTSLIAAPAAPGAAATVPIQAAPPASPAGPALSFQLKRLDIARGTMGFADYSIQPNFEARIDELQGSISNITNLPGQVAAIDLAGQVIDRFSPATIKGTMDLLGYDRHTDMHLTFRNIELPVFNPYSGRYAGYAIAKGKLTTELSYKIDNRALKADHHIIVNQLEWGEATDSKEKVPLPVRLATALLKDSNGVIDLDVPVTGSLDDPKFRIGPIIWQIIGNILEKAVTAPFRLIGSLFAGAEKAQYVDFTPGSPNLPDGAAQSLGALAKALTQRPELQLDIPAGPGIREDAAKLADAQIDALLMAKESKKGAPVDVATLDSGEQLDRLEDFYRAKLGKKPAYPDFPPEALKAAPGAKPDASDDDRRTLLEAQWLRAQLQTAFAPSTAQLTALGSARAVAVRDALLTGSTVDPARVFMATAMTVTPTDGHSRLELKLK